MEQVLVDAEAFETIIDENGEKRYACECVICGEIYYDGLSGTDHPCYNTDD